VYRVEGEAYIEQLWRSAAFARATQVDFRWEGVRYHIPRPAELGDVHFVRLLGPDFEAEEPLELVLVRKRGWWEGLRGAVRRSRPVVLESAAEVERIGEG